MNATPSPSGDVTLQRSGDTFLGGTVSKSAASAMRSSGVALFQNHAIDCPATAAALKSRR